MNYFRKIWAVERCRLLFLKGALLFLGLAPLLLMLLGFNDAVLFMLAAGCVHLVHLEYQKYKHKKLAKENGDIK